MPKRNIHLFGSSTTTGSEIKKMLKFNFSKDNLIFHIRGSKESAFIDLNNFSNFDETYINNENIIISLAPIWLISKFIKYLENEKPKMMKTISLVYAVSSSSIITKKYAFCDYDKNLVMRLEEAEMELLQIYERNKFDLIIFRPTMIYGNINGAKDKNLNIISKILRKIPIILLPSKTGNRQPIHAKQLASLIIFYLKSNINKENKNKIKNLINVGGDTTLNYYSMIKKLQSSMPQNDPGRKCMVIKVPNYLFFFSLSFLLIINPKLYESILRISSNLSGFKEVHKLTGSKKQDFPIL